MRIEYILRRVNIAFEPLKGSSQGVKGANGDRIRASDRAVSGVVMIRKVRSLPYTRVLPEDSIK